MFGIQKVKEDDLTLLERYETEQPGDFLVCLIILCL